jgi:uncharacterized coiled-coil DUF342 family protein
MNQKLENIIKEIKDYKGKAKALHKTAFHLCAFATLLDNRLRKTEDEKSDVLTLLYNLKTTFSDVRDTWKSINKKVTKLGKELYTVSSEWDIQQGVLSSFTRVIRNWPSNAPDTQMIAVPLGWCREAQHALQASKISNTLIADEVLSQVEECRNNLAKINRLIEGDMKQVAKVEDSELMKCPVCKGSGKDPILIDVNTNEELSCSNCDGSGVA